tara:strand:+ start:145 stop:888 length:744 start_codon:yes stop_codon:yes gene_type:complete
MSPTKSVKNQIIIQNDSGYRYSIEPFLLVDFCILRPRQEVLDIGTGCGVIPLLMINREPELKITGIEIQGSAVVIARQNASKNKKQIKFLDADFLDKELTFSSEQFDVIISNPPYRKINSGRMNLDEGKAIARHELKLNLQDMLEKANPFLKKGGHINLAYPPIRLEETLRELENQKLFPSRIRFIHGNKNAEAKIFLIDAIKGKKSDLIVDSPLYVYNRGGSYTKEMQEIYDSFNCVNGSDHIGKK